MSMSDNAPDIPYGVNWSWQHGARCPACGKLTRRSYKTLPWYHSCRERYHVCLDCGQRFKSVAVDVIVTGETQRPGSLLEA